MTDWSVDRSTDAWTQNANAKFREICVRKINLVKLVLTTDDRRVSLMEVDKVQCLDKWRHFRARPVGEGRAKTAIFPVPLSPCC